MVTIPANSTSAPINVTGVVRNATPVTITATLNGVSRSGTVRVLGDGIAVDIPTFTALTPPTARSRSAAPSSLTALLDLPAGAVLALTVSDLSSWTLRRLRRTSRSTR